MSYVCVGVVPKGNGGYKLLTNQNGTNLSPATRHLIGKDKPVDEIDYVMKMKEDHVNPNILYLMMEVNMIQMSRISTNSCMMKNGVGTSLLENCFTSLIMDDEMLNNRHDGAYVVFYFDNSTVSAMNYHAFQKDIFHGTGRTPHVPPKKVVSVHDPNESQVMMAYYFTKDEVEQQRNKQIVYE